MRLLCLVLALLGLASPATADTALLNRLEAVRLSHDLAGVVGARIERGRVVAIEAAGCARFAEDGRRCVLALQPHQKMRVASISKLFVAYAAQRLVQEGKLDLNRDVSDYLDFRLRNPAFPDAPITVGQLLTHTSSLRDEATYWALVPNPLSSLFTGDRFFAKDHAPGTFFTYANINTGVLGTVLERASGERFDRLLQRVVFGPAGITAGYNWIGAESVPAPQVATLYRKRDAQEVWDSSGPWRPQVDGAGAQALVRGIDGPVALPADYVIGSNGSLFSPQGGLRISGRDVARLLTVMARGGRLEGKALLSPARARSLVAPVWQANAERTNGATEKDFFLGYGLGAHRFTVPGSPTLYAGHFADAFGLLGGAGIDPVSGNGFVYLITGFASDPMPDDQREPGAPGYSSAEAAAIRAILRQ
jgi:CubicO group peptidase (beta-lactamase class C family)